MADLWWLMLVLGTATFVLFMVLLGLALRDRAASAGARRWWLFGGGVVLPIVVVGITFAFTLGVMRAVPDAAPADALQVDVVARQFDYEVRYPQHGVSTEGELHLPVDERVQVTLHSADVVHSFWIPQLIGKTDMLPDAPNTVVVQAEEVGTYAGRCAEFCGLHHTLMEFDAVVHERDDFDAWLAANR